MPARTSPRTPASPAWVLPGAGARAYARPALTVAQATALRDHAGKLLSHDEQRTVVQAIRADTVEGTLPVALMMSFVPQLISGDRFLLGDAVGNAVTDFGESEGSRSGSRTRSRTRTCPPLGRACGRCSLHSRVALAS